ncbi:2-oxo-4-hydroxy-4-carboxy-5-ureidoimidazoline decarboxylase [Rhodococcoides kyotonense]|uniref:2-oxo-4-hydroxy-4-carboxy--5-ureidoimidazoline (OHCU) decarboxylase n=1 Tax=Rhodococcoides kyotonense TaxID=398843 RepID=A0A239GTR1_9NOCA|nr:2-oxo-4-hydroxy-4-carboxy-5-ureidoimidazoline decarboxylase [Rhodococcus kyotonensis]SNS71464.1 2-oxo-4-hydroxy-4-carboxy--5-ureidoimidazoline (OHCU) decarboxylase [Rhodococcus kyotonensis]
MMMHQGLGLETFNDLPRRKAVHALYECCGSVTWASQVADGRAYASYSDFLTRADVELGELSDRDVDVLASTHPPIGRTCAGLDAATQSVLIDACRMYVERFEFGYIVCSVALQSDGDAPRAVLMDLGHRLDNDRDTERKVMREELAKINRARLQKLLGPEGGWPPY